MTLAFVGSNPAIPANDPLAQLAEQLPFKQWVWSSNLQRVTKKRRHPNGVSSFFRARGDSNNLKCSMPVACCCHQCKHWWLLLFSPKAKMQTNLQRVTTQITETVQADGQWPPLQVLFSPKAKMQTNLLLRCPAAASPDKAGSRLADRCHSLPSLPLPQAEVGSLPSGSHGEAITQRVTRTQCVREGDADCHVAALLAMTEEWGAAVGSLPSGSQRKIWRQYRRTANGRPLQFSPKAKMQTNLQRVTWRSHNPAGHHARRMEFGRGVEGAAPYSFRQRRKCKRISSGSHGEAITRRVTTQGVWNSTIPPSKIKDF